MLHTSPARGQEDNAHGKGDAQGGQRHLVGQLEHQRHGHLADSKLGLGVGQPGLFLVIPHRLEALAVYHHLLDLLDHLFGDIVHGGPGWGRPPPRRAGAGGVMRTLELQYTQMASVCAPVRVQGCAAVGAVETVGLLGHIVLP